MEEKDKKDERNNVILLTVIAVVTLIIVVVGATFAYLGSSIVNNTNLSIQADVNASSDFFVISSTGGLAFEANLENLKLCDAEEKDDDGNCPSLTNTSSVSVSLVTKADKVDHYYNMYLSIEKNDFEYSNGLCYTQPYGKDSDKTTEYTLESDCTTAGNYWARNSDGLAGCYKDDSERLISAEGSSTLGESFCTVNASNVWETIKTPELILAVYEYVDNSNSNNEKTCIYQGVESNVSSLGKCMDYSTGEAVDGVNQADCNGTTQKWVKFVTDKVSGQGGCMEPVEYIDLTSMASTYTTDGSGVSTNNPIKLNSEVYAISASNTNGGNGKANKYYYAELQMINFYNINQLVNGQKTFTGSLTVSQVENEAS